MSPLGPSAQHQSSLQSPVNSYPQGTLHHSPSICQSPGISRNQFQHLTAAQGSSQSAEQLRSYPQITEQSRSYHQPAIASISSQMPTASSPGQWQPLTDFLEQSHFSAQSGSHQPPGTSTQSLLSVSEPVTHPSQCSMGPRSSSSPPAAFQQGQFLGESASHSDALVRYRNSHPSLSAPQHYQLFAAAAASLQNNRQLVSPSQTPHYLPGPTLRPLQLRATLQGPAQSRCSSPSPLAAATAPYGGQIPGSSKRKATEIRRIDDVDSSTQDDGSSSARLVSKNHDKAAVLPRNPFKRGSSTNWKPGVSGTQPSVPSPSFISQSFLCCIRLTRSQCARVSEAFNAGSRISWPSQRRQHHGEASDEAALPNHSRSAQ